MKRWLFVICLLAGCSEEEPQLTSPPNVTVHVKEATHDTILGTHCWVNTCVDKAGAVELVKDTAPIAVTAGDEVSLSIDGDAPSEQELVMFHQEAEQHILLDKQSFQAPSEEGIYVYSYGVWWRDGEVSTGDAFYAFKLQVVD